jgi:hypothetical protein
MMSRRGPGRIQPRVLGVSPTRTVNPRTWEATMLAIAGTGYSLIGLLVIILLVVMIVYFLRRA